MSDLSICLSLVPLRHWLFVVTIVDTQIDKHSVSFFIFLRQVLSHEAVRTFIDENFLFWAGDISNPDAFQIATEMDVTDYPCLLVMGILAAGTNKPTLVERSVSCNAFCSCFEIPELFFHTRVGRCNCDFVHTSI